MEHTVASIKRYILLIRLFASFGFHLESAYVINFVSATFGKLLRIALIILFFHSIAIAVPNIPGWNVEGLYTIAATFYIVDLFASVLFHRNLLFHVPRAIQSGTFDTILIKPIPKLFHAAFQRIDIGDFIAFVPFVAFWTYAVTTFEVEITVQHSLLYIAFIFNALVFVFAVVLILASAAFWTVRGDGMGRLVDHISGTATFPLDIYRGNIRFIAFYVVPVAVISVIPAQALFGIAKPFDLLYSIAVTLILLAVAVGVWNAGLRRYSSASS